MRLFLAIKAFFKILFSGQYADEVRALSEGPKQLPEGPTEEDLDKAHRDAVKAPAVLLSLLQREARLIDFIQEDIASFADTQIGAAVRPVHSGCRKVFAEDVQLESIKDAAEGTQVEVPEGFDPSAIRLSGNVKGSPPFKGVLHHHGWRIKKLDLPQRPDSHTPEVVAPAEIEVK